MAFALDFRPLIPRLTVLTACWTAVLASAAPAQTTLYVDQHALPPSDGLTWQTAYPDLQDALDAAAVPGSGVTEIRVAGGSTYKPDRGTGDRTATCQMVNGVAIYGGYAGVEGTDPDARDPAIHVTVLSGDLSGNDGQDFTNYGDNSHHVVTVPSTVTDGENTLLDGLTIRGGNSEGAAAEFGGAMLIQAGNLTINGCIIRENRAPQGGGIRINPDSLVILTNCQFMDNSTSAVGGGAIGMWRSQMQIQNCTFFRNQSADRGGAISFGDAANALISHCLFVDNGTPTYGGAVFQWGNSGLTVLNSVFFRNAAAACGGGISSHGGDLKLLGCTLFANSCDCADGGGGIQKREYTIEVHNTILWGNSALRASIEEQQLLLQVQPVTTVTYSCIQGLSGALGGEGNIGLDPRFVDAAGGNLRLQGDSPAIDAGDNDVVPPGVTLDLDGLPRFMDMLLVPDTGNGTPPIVDMGAYEAQPAFQDCNGNGVDDAVDIATGTSMDCNLNGRPDECDLDDETSLDCNDNGYPDECEVQAFHDCCAVGHGAGCSAPLIRDCVCVIDPYCCTVEWDRVCVGLVDSGGCGTCQIPQAEDCDDNGVPDECQPDFDGDGLIDACDPDIDDDGVPNGLDVCDYTPPGAQVEPDGGVLGDLDGDCDVDLEDFAIMQDRFTGPGSR